ncbi:MAG: lamin tail domain-containing protein [Nanoarchaeota archaeon]
MNNMNRILFCLIFVSSMAYASAVVELTEIVPNPEGADDAHQPQGEWVELYNYGEEPVNLTGYVLKDDHDDHRLPLDAVLSPQSYFVIYRDGDRDFSLNNEGDSVRLFSLGGELIDEMRYNSSPEGMSWSKINGEWQLASPTPKAENTVSTSTSCDYALTLVPASLVFLSDVDFTVFIHRLQGISYPLTVRGTVETVAGKVVKEYAPWTNRTLPATEEKEYSPRLPSGTYLVHFWLEHVSCDDTNRTNDEANILIAVRSSEQENNSTLSIERLSLGKDNTTMWGDALPVTVHIYKGDESKQVGELYAEMNGKKVSPAVKITMPEKYTSYDLTVSLLLDTNCDTSLPDGTAKVILEAFGQQVEMPFTVERTNPKYCPSPEKPEKPEKSKTQKREEPFISQKDTPSKLTYTLPEIPTILKPGTVYSLPLHMSNEEKEHEFTAWAYLYRGSVCYSCSSRQEARESHAVTLDLSPHEQKTDFLPLISDDVLSPGAYMLKVKIRKDDQKTTKDFTYNVTVVASELQEHAELLSKQQEEQRTSVLGSLSPVEEQPRAASRTILPESVGIIVYESNDQKAKRTIPYILIAGFGLLSVIVVWQKQIMKDTNKL